MVGERERLNITTQIQSNLDYSKCQGPPDFLLIIRSSNFRNRLFSEMFGSFRSILIFDGISIKLVSKGISTFCMLNKPLKIKSNKAT